MIKTVLLALIVFLTNSCTSTDFKTKNFLTFQIIETFKPGKVSTFEIEEKLGMPDEIRNENNKQVWTYIDSSTGYQRLTLKFNESKILESHLWVPFDGEPESKIAYIKNKFSKSEFLALKSDSTHPHVVKAPTSYRDLKMGISFMVEFGERVEAIAFFEPSSLTNVTSQK